MTLIWPCLTFFGNYFYLCLFISDLNLTLFDLFCFSLLLSWKLFNLYWPSLWPYYINDLIWPTSMTLLDLTSLTFPLTSHQWPYLTSLHHWPYLTSLDHWPYLTSHEWPCYNTDLTWPYTNDLTWPHINDLTTPLTLSHHWPCVTSHHWPYYYTIDLTWDHIIDFTTSPTLLKFTSTTLLQK